MGDMKNPDSTPFGELIKQARTAQGLSQEGLAKLSGVSQGAVSMIESGQTQSMNSTTLLKLTTALQIALPVIATESNEQAVLNLYRSMSPESRAEWIASAARILGKQAR